MATPSQTDIKQKLASFIGANKNAANGNPCANIPTPYWVQITNLDPGTDNSYVIQFPVGGTLYLCYEYGLGGNPATSMTIDTTTGTVDVSAGYSTFDINDDALLYYTIGDITTDSIKLAYIVQ